ncbi:5-oxoprolinase subunit PxpA [Echinicola marina]|uniref:5-oxoprolinase subunit PxpA n=1 Tax=Echinicola marina TaxID=2859768 RepID=UPI001CF6B552|nr:5-oxoprolinase subunit PxpA [Echinicola marina]UCS92927.1 5-oxoprolinase subunit PxpA [Echinicola marina]
MGIDINSDLGEGSSADAAIMQFISSCNIACGGHAGDEKSMVSTIKHAMKHQVNIGAHPSYPDPENFGRKVINISLEALENSILDQILTFQKLLSDHKSQLHHIKAHGALYNESAINGSIAHLLVKIMKDHFPGILLYVPYNSVIAEMAEKAGIPVWYEIFADRNYEDNLKLVNRKKPNALLHDTNEVLEHLELMIQQKKVKTISGNLFPIKADTICVHGDNERALNLAKAINQMVKSKSYSQ